MTISIWRRAMQPLRRSPLHPQWLLGTRESILPWLRKNSRGRVLDVGCADRWIEPHLALECEYFSLDYPATGAARYGARPDFFADAAKLPIASESIDTVVMLEVLEHLEDPRGALQEAARVLRQGGKLALSMPLLYPVHDAPFDYQRYTIHGLTREIDAVGLRLEEARPTLNSAEAAWPHLVLGYRWHMHGPD